MQKYCSQFEQKEVPHSSPLWASYGASLLQYNSMISDLTNQKTPHILPLQMSYAASLNFQKNYRGPLLPAWISSNHSMDK